MLPVNELKTLNLLNIMRGSTFFIQPEAMLIYLRDKPYDKCFDRHPAFFFLLSNSHFTSPYLN